MVAFFSKLAGASLALSSTVLAFHLPTPPNYYYGNLRTSLTCNAVDLGLVGLSLDSYAVAGGASTVQQGQSFYTNDVAANLTIPAAVASALGLAVDHVNIQVFIVLDLVGLSPAILNAVPEGVWINGTRFNLLQDTKVVAPPGNKVIAHLGPARATGDVGSAAQIFVRNATANLFLYGGAGELIRKVTLTCQRPPYAALLATYNIVAPRQVQPPTLDAGNGYLVPYPPINEQQKFICYGLQYNGSISASPYVFEASTCGYVPAYIPTNDVTSFTNSTTEIVISSSQIAALKRSFPGATSFDYTLNSFIMNATNTAPSSLDGASKPPPTTRYTLPTTGSQTLVLGPGNGFAFGPYTAVAPVGQFVYYQPDVITQRFTFYNSAGATIGTSDVVLRPAVRGFKGPGAQIVPTGATSNPTLTGL